MAEIVAKAHEAQESDEPVARKLGTEGGRDVMMTFHHSRDTLAKQWHETWVLALGASARIYRSFLPQLMKRRAFPRTWEALLNFLQQSLLATPNGSSEVALAAISACHSLLLSSQSRAARSSGQPPLTAASAVPSDLPSSVGGAEQPDTPAAIPLSLIHI